MPKKTSGKDRTSKGKASRKISDLAPKRVKGGEADAVKGGDPPIKGEIRW